MKIKKRGGFTLMELVIVIAVSSVLMTTIMLFTVSVSDYMSRREDAVDISEEHIAVRKFLTNCFADNDGEPSVGVIAFSDNILSYCGETFRCDYLNSVSVLSEGKIYKFELTYSDGRNEQTFRVVLVSRRTDSQ